ncbi:MAG: tetratricopeptide repeat protein [Chloroflexaceae bacterium]|nr:tetratricopeptide repeat protein [Chloroflexaceae bacterium]
MQIPDASTAPAPAPAPQKGGRTRTFFIGCGVTAALLVLGFIGIAVLGSMAAQRAAALLTTAREQQAAGDYDTALTTLDSVFTDYGTYDAADEARGLYPQLQLESAAALREDGQFEPSLERYDEVLSAAYAERFDAGSEEYADAVEQAAALTDDATTGKLETRLAWGESLTSEGDFAAAQEQIEQVINEAAAGSDIDERARAALPAVYIGRAEEAMTAGDAATAFERLDFVLTNYQSGPGREAALASFATMAEPFYGQAQQHITAGEFATAEDLLVGVINYAPDAPIVSQIRSELPTLYLNWGAAAAAAGNYEEAIGVYEFLIAEFPESELVPQAQTALVDARVAAVAASGTAGELPPPQASGSTGGETSTYDVTNDTVCPILVLLSGPQSQAVEVPSQQNTQFEVQPGIYNLVVQIDEEQTTAPNCMDIIPFTNQSTFDPGFIYTSSFFISIEP